MTLPFFAISNFANCYFRNCHGYTDRSNTDIVHQRYKRYLTFHWVLFKKVFWNQLLSDLFYQCRNQTLSSLSIRRFWWERGTREAKKGEGERREILTLTLPFSAPSPSPLGRPDTQARPWDKRGGGGGGGSSPGSAAVDNRKIAIINGNGYESASVYLREGFRKTPNILDEHNGYPKTF